MHRDAHAVRLEVAFSQRVFAGSQLGKRVALKNASEVLPNELSELCLFHVPRDKSAVLHQRA